VVVAGTDRLVLPAGHYPWGARCGQADVAWSQSRRRSPSIQEATPDPPVTGGSRAGCSRAPIGLRISEQPNDLPVGCRLWYNRVAAPRWQLRRLRLMYGVSRQGAPAGLVGGTPEVPEPQAGQRGDWFWHAWKCRSRPRGDTSHHPPDPPPNRAISWFHDNGCGRLLP
jgi:hypothetical protein